MNRQIGNKYIAAPFVDFSVPESMYSEFALIVNHRHTMRMNTVALRKVEVCTRAVFVRAGRETFFLWVFFSSTFQNHGLCSPEASWRQIAPQPPLFPLSSPPVLLWPDGVCVCACVCVRVCV